MKGKNQCKSEMKFPSEGIVLMPTSARMECRATKTTYETHKKIVNTITPTHTWHVTVMTFKNNHEHLQLVCFSYSKIKPSSRHSVVLLTFRLTRVTCPSNHRAHTRGKWSTQVRLHTPLQHMAMIIHIYILAFSEQFHYTAVM